MFSGGRRVVLAGVAALLPVAAVACDEPRPAAFPEPAPSVIASPPSPVLDPPATPSAQFALPPPPEPLEVPNGSDPPEPASADPPRDPVVAPSAPPASPRGCEVRYTVRVARSQNTFDLIARATNTTDHEVALELEDHCPSGPITFRGLPGSYDYYGGCARGACARHGSRLPFKIAPHATVELARANVEPAGRHCNPPLAHRLYGVTFDVPSGTRACGPNTATLDWRTPEATVRPAPPVPGGGSAVPSP